MNGNRGNPRAPSAHELELQTSMHELLKALERTLTHARQVDNSLNTDLAPVLRDTAMHSRLASSALYRISNMLTPIGRLPDDVLAEILLSAVEERVVNGYINDPCRWEYLMHVCSRWSALMRADSRFWTSIDFDWNQTTIERHLSLTKDSLLSLRIPTFGLPLLEFKHLLLPGIGRAKEIQIKNSQFFAYDCPHTFTIASTPSRTSKIDSDGLLLKEDAFAGIQCSADFLIASAPHLSKLLVRCEHPGISGNRPHFLPPLQHLSSLTSLELYDCALNNKWNKIFPSSLHRLCIANRMFDFGKPKVDIIDIIRLLEHCPDLNSLEITGTSIVSTSDAFTPTKKGTVCARQLRSLTVSDMLTSEWDLLVLFVQLPSLSELHNTIAFAHQLPSLPAHLCERMGEASSATLKFWTDCNTYTYSGTQTATGLAFKHVLSIVWKDRALHPFISKPDWTQVVEQSITHFTQLKCVAIDIDAHCFGSCRKMSLQWYPLLKSLSTLTSLDIQGTIEVEFFGALMGSTLFGFPTSIACPGLISLLIQSSSHMIETINAKSRGIDP